MYQVKVGDDLLYHPSKLDEKDQRMTHFEDQPLGAHCSYVWSSGLVNCSVFDANGINHGRTSIPFWDGTGECPYTYSESAWCEPNTRQNMPAAQAEEDQDIS